MVFKLGNERYRFLACTNHIKIRGGKIMKKCFNELKNQFSKNLGVSAIGLTLCLLGIVLALSFGNLPLTKLLLFCLIVFSVWVYEDDLAKVEEECKEDEHEENIIYK